MELSLPALPEQYTPEVLTALVSQFHPGASVTSMKVIKDYKYGYGEVSMSPRAVLELEYGPGTPADFPSNVVLKLSYDLDDGVDNWLAHLSGFFENEVNFYNRVQPGLKLETPRSLGGYFDPRTRRYALLLEDISYKGVRFFRTMDDLSAQDVADNLDTQARLHAAYWESPRFSGDLAWVGTHLEGTVTTLIRTKVAAGVQAEIDKMKFKQEILGRLGTSGPELFAGMCAVQRHHATLPQTLLHGDCHINNAYRLPDDTCGMLDFQVFFRGYAMHDVAYFIPSALSIEDRRKNELDLLAFYRDRLGSYGVANLPDMDALWLEYCRASLWPLYIGWLPCPIENYGWEVMAVALNRVASAYEDHETRELVAKLE